MYVLGDSAKMPCGSQRLRVASACWSGEVAETFLAFAQVPRQGREQVRRRAAERRPSVGVLQGTRGALRQRVRLVIFGADHACGAAALKGMFGHVSCQ